MLVVLDAMAISFVETRWRVSEIAAVLVWMSAVFLSISDRLVAMFVVLDAMAVSFAETRRFVSVIAAALVCMSAVFWSMPDCWSRCAGLHR